MLESRNGTIVARSYSDKSTSNMSSINTRIDIISELILKFRLTITILVENLVSTEF